MVPAAFVSLPALPLTANGKLDRGALARRRRRRGRSSASSFRAPRGSVEEALAAVWARVLGLDRVGRRRQLLRPGRRLDPQPAGADPGAASAASSSISQQLFRHQTVAELAPAAAAGAAHGGGPRRALLSARRRRPRRRCRRASKTPTRSPAAGGDALPPGGDAGVPALSQRRQPARSAVRCHPATFQQAIDRAVARHPVLRTALRPDFLRRAAATGACRRQAAARRRRPARPGRPRAAADPRRLRPGGEAPPLRPPAAAAAAPPPPSPGRGALPAHPDRVPRHPRRLEPELDPGRGLQPLPGRGARPAAAGRAAAGRRLPRLRGAGAPGPRGPRPAPVLARQAGRRRGDRAAAALRQPPRGRRAGEHRPGRRARHASRLGWSAWPPPPRCRSRASAWRRTCGCCSSPAAAAT